MAGEVPDVKLDDHTERLCKVVELLVRRLRPDLFPRGRVRTGTIEGVPFVEDLSQPEESVRFV